MHTLLPLQNPRILLLLRFVSDIVGAMGIITLAAKKTEKAAAQAAGAAPAAGAAAAPAAGAKDAKAAAPAKDKKK